MRVVAQNYRRAASIGRLTAGADGDLMLIVGPNASGKTTLVDAARIALYGESVDGKSANSGRLIASMSRHDMGDVECSITIGETEHRFSRHYDGQVLNRGDWAPTDGEGLPVVSTVNDLVSGGVSAKRAMARLAGALCRDDDLENRITAAESRAKKARAEVKQLSSERDGAIRIVGADDIPTDTQIDAARAKVASMGGETCGRCPYAEDRDNAALTAAVAELRRLEELGKHGPALARIRGLLSDAEAELASAIAELRKAEYEAGLSASVVEMWFSKFPVGIRADGGDVVTTHDDNAIPLIAFSGAMSQWLTQIAVPSVVLQTWPLEHRIICADVDQMAGDELTRAMDAVKAMYDNTKIRGAVMATCHEPGTIPSGWEVVRL